MSSDNIALDALKFIRDNGGAKTSAAQARLMETICALTGVDESHFRYTHNTGAKFQTMDDLVRYAARLLNPHAYYTHEDVGTTTFLGAKWIIGVSYNNTLLAKHDKSGSMLYAERKRLILTDPTNCELWLTCKKASYVLVYNMRTKSFTSIKSTQSYPYIDIRPALGKAVLRSIRNGLVKKGLRYAGIRNIDRSIAYDYLLRNGFTVTGRGICKRAHEFLNKNAICYSSKVYPRGKPNSQSTLLISNPEYIGAVSHLELLRMRPARRIKMDTGIIITSSSFEVVDYQCPFKNRSVRCPPVRQNAPNRVLSVVTETNDGGVFHFLADTATGLIKVYPCDHHQGRLSLSGQNGLPWEEIFNDTKPNRVAELMKLYNPRASSASKHYNKVVASPDSVAWAMENISRTWGYQHDGRSSDDPRGDGYILLNGEDFTLHRVTSEL